MCACMGSDLSNKWPKKNSYALHACGVSGCEVYYCFLVSLAKVRCVSCFGPSCQRTRVGASGRLVQPKCSVLCRGVAWRGAGLACDSNVRPRDVQGRQGRLFSSSVITAGYKPFVHQPRHMFMPGSWLWVDTEQHAALLSPLLYPPRQIRKDLSKTLETLKTVVRRAPKRRVKVEGMPLPASKPRGFCQSRKNDEASRHAHRDPVIANASGAATATSADAPATTDEGTFAPFSSVLRGEDGNRGGDNGSRVARTTFEELPEEPTAPTTLPPPPEPEATKPLAPCECDVLPAKPVAAARPEGCLLYTSDAADE